MKTVFALLLLFPVTALRAQYYYRDIIGTRESSKLIKTYLNAGVTAVSVSSYDAEGTKDDAFLITQTFSKPHALLRTTTRNGDAGESVLLSYADSNGRIRKTIDSSATLTSTTEYGYARGGQLTSLRSTTTDTAKRLNETEIHLWDYNNGDIARMLRIVNGTDTTIVTFKLDGGKVAEEQSTRRGVAASPVYYYYNAQGQLTDIVRYNPKAGRLLPEYMFEYGADGNVVQKITVPSNSSAYLIWRYQYNGEGLKIREAIYDRYKTLTGKVEYQYTRSE